MDQTNTESPEENKEEEQLYTSLRAQSFSEFCGHDAIKESLLITIQAAQQRKDILEHVLFYGPPGLGKTTLSHLIAKQAGVNIRTTTGTALTKAGDLAAILTNLEPGDVLFIDEIHRLPKMVEETLYPAMEDYVLDIIIGKGPSARTIRLDLPKFTLVGATTRYGLLAGPFRDRFGLVYRLTYYSPENLITIIQRAADKLHITIEEPAANMIAHSARGTPRVALKLLKRVRDYSEVGGYTVITVEQVKKAMKLLDIDSFGLDQHDRQLLTYLITKHNGGPVGLTSIAASLNEDPGTIEEVVEPYLLQTGFLKRTPQGRVVTPDAYKHLGFTLPKKSV